ncbi:MAG: aldo/keto reductase [Paracoccaceae bacterium]|nr:aldo/keto reductase [Paracoccaceae bacterium]
MQNSILTSRNIIQSKLSLPIFGFGSAHLGEMYNLVDEEISQKTLHGAWNAGIRYFDTAPWYGRGLAEHRLGGFLRTKPREEFIITTKVGRTLHRPSKVETFKREPWLGGLNFEVKFDYSYDGIMRSYEQALQRLSLDTIDALVIHDLDPLFHSPEEQTKHESDLESTGLKALKELKSAGDIKAFGMGINQKDSLAILAQRLPLDFALVAMPYTLLDQESLHDGMQKCLMNSTSVIIGAPFASGILATGSGNNSKYGYANASEELQLKVRQIEAVCKEHEVRLKAAALQFVLAHPAVVSTIPGAINVDQVTENIDCLESKIPEIFWKELKTKDLIAIDAPTPKE